MKFLSRTHREFIPPATYRVWRRAGVIDYLGIWIAITFFPIFTEAMEHDYRKLIQLIAIALVVLVGIALLPARRMGKPAIEITDDILTVRMRFYIPTRTERVSLGELHRVMIAGPRGDRDWIFETKDGAMKELRPYLGEAITNALVPILQNAAAGRFAVIVKAPYVPEP